MMFVNLRDIFSSSFLPELILYERFIYRRFSCMHTDYKLNRYRPSPDALLNPCSDEVFKALFTNESEESRTALRSFLTAVLHKEVKNVELRPNEPPILDDSDKAVRFDVSCTFNNGEAADVEMQGVNKYSSFGMRAEYLSARLLNTVFHKGDDWQTMPEVYQISLLNFIFDKNDPAAVGYYRMQKDNGHLLSGIQTVIFLELPKIDALGNMPPETLHSEEKWCKFLIDADNPSKQDYINKLTASDGGIMEAKKTLDKISSDWVLWKRELDREVIERDHNSELHYAKEQGLQQGTLQAKRDDARNFKALGVPVQTIAQATGLSEDEIAGL
jgi:predicted transposase/invertase (TIGR01784 family)